MNEYFDIGDTVYDITEKYPETIDVFISNGFKQLANEKMRKMMGRTISLKMVCKSKGMDLGLFTQKLIGAIERKRGISRIDVIPSVKEDGGDIRIEGVLPCPVRIPLLEGFGAWMEENEDRFDFKVDYELKSAHIGVDWIREKIKSDDEDSLSDLFISAGFDLFFDRNLMGRFKSAGVFEDMSGLDRLNRDFDNDYIDLKDPQRQYSIIGVVPAVFVVNTEELEGRRIPTTWEELLEPEFEDSISLPVHDYDLFNAILLNIYKNHGKEGIYRLGKSMLRSMHPAEMVKSHIKKRDSKIPTITVMPYIFTHMIKPDSPLKPIWPRDGSIISPIFLLAKKANRDRIKPFVDFFFSKELGDILSDNGKFPSTNPNVENHLGDEDRFMWLGWDYINSNDIGQLIRESEDIFYDAVRG